MHILAVCCGERQDLKRIVFGFLHQQDIVAQTINRTGLFRDTCKVEWSVRLRKAGVEFAQRQQSFDLHERSLAKVMIESLSGSPKGTTFCCAIYVSQSPAERPEGVSSKPFCQPNLSRAVAAAGGAQSVKLAGECYNGCSGVSLKTSSKS